METTMKNTIIMNGIEYEELPRLILYEYYLKIKGERIVFLWENKLDYQGYNELYNNNLNKLLYINILNINIVFFNYLLF